MSRCGECQDHVQSKDAKKCSMCHKLLHYDCGINFNELDMFVCKVCAAYNTGSPVASKCTPRQDDIADDDSTTAISISYASAHKRKNDDLIDSDEDSMEDSDDDDVYVVKVVPASGLKLVPGASTKKPRKDKKPRAKKDKQTPKNPQLNMSQAEVDQGVSTETRIRTPHDGTEGLRKPESSLTSPWWNGYHKFEDESRANEACCNNCGNAVKLGKKQGTTNLKSHYINKHHDDATFIKAKWGKEAGANEGNLETMKPTTKQTTISTLLRKKVSPEQIRKDLARAITECIIANNLPLCIVEDEKFRAMLGQASLHGDNTPCNISTENIMSNILDLDDLVLKMLKRRMRGQVIASTTDHWTSKAMHNYESHVAHFITEDAQLECLTVECALVNGPSSADEIARGYDRFWRQQTAETGASVFACVTDSASNMNSMGTILGTKGIDHVYCADHIFQLVAKVAFNFNFKTLQADGTLRNSLTAAKKLVAFFRSSHKKSAELNALQKARNRKPLVLLQDCETRWWSTYAMITRLLELKPFIVEIFGLVNDRSNMKLTAEDWIVLEQLKSLLKPFKQAQELLEGHKYVTVSLIPFLVGMVSENCAAMAETALVSDDVAACARAMENDIYRRFGDVLDQFRGEVVRGAGNRQEGIHPAVWIAYALDPRFHEVLPDLNDDDQKALLRATIKKLMIAEMRSMENSHNSHPEEAPESPMRFAQQIEEPSSPNFILRRHEAQKVIRRQSRVSQPIRTSHEERAQFELSNFIAEQGIELHDIEIIKDSNGNPVQDGKGRQKTKLIYNDPLEWWKERRGKFPIIWRLARKYLAIPATSASSERIFSRMSNIIDPTRTRLSPERASALLRIHDNLHLL